MDDPEVRAMGAIAEAMSTLEELDDAARQRVLTWMMHRWGPFPAAAPAPQPEPEAPYSSGQELDVYLDRRGRKESQAQGDLEDGSLVLVDDADHLLGQTARVVVTNVRRSRRGFMVFAKLPDAYAARRLEDRWGP